MSNYLIKARGLGVTRNGRQILQRADLTLQAGKIVTLIGPNGAGKTTLVRAVLGLIKVDEGKIEKAPDLRIGYMPQKLHIDASLPLTVARFLALGGKARADLTETLTLTGIDKLTNMPMQSLSGGETQRVLLARALLRDPQLLVLDEPVQGVDVTGQSALYALINEIRNRRQCGVLLISHDLHLVMASANMPLAEYFPPRSYGVVVRKGKYLSPQARAFIELIQPHLFERRDYDESGHSER